MKPTRWDDLAAEYRQITADLDEVALEAIVGGLGDSFTKEDIERFRRCDPPDAEALARLLDDRRTRHFVKTIVFAARAVPEPLFLPMLQAGVRTVDLSYNKQFIWPCVLCHGCRRTMAALIRQAKEGSNADKAGALHALYWGSMSPSDAYWPHDGRRVTRPAEEETVTDLSRELEDWALKEFLANPDVEVRRALLPYLPDTSSTAPAELERAIAIAESHDDPYIRDRIAAQLGRSALFPALPRRRSRSTGGTHRWIAVAAAGWSLIFAAFHVVWAAGWYVGLDPETAARAFARPTFLAYDVIVAAMCLIAVPVSLALGTTWNIDMPRRLFVTLAWVGSVLLGIRSAASLAQGAYELVTGRFTLQRMGVWEPWFYVGAALFGVNLWLYERDALGRRARD